MKLFKKEIILLLVIIVFASLWRFVNYQDRWTLQQDQARDAIIALFSIQTGQLPTLGPPSSAGDFSFGPLYYWIIIFFNFILPFINGPWIGFTLLSVLAVVLFFYMGKQIGGLPFAVILGLISGFSSTSVFHSVDLLNPMLLIFFVPLSFWAMVKTQSQKSFLYPVILGFAVGAAINAHLQGLGLIFLLILTIIFNSQKVKTSLGVILGFLIAFVPLIYFDLKNQGIWIKSIFEYLKVGQNKFNIIYSWTQDLVFFWPKLWGEVIANIPLLGYFLIGLFILSLGLTHRAKQFSKIFYIIFVTFLLQIVILKYYKGPRLPVYLILNHSFIIFFVSWSLWRTWVFNKVVAVILIFAVLSLSTYSNIKIVNSQSQTPAIYALKKEIEKIIPENKQVYSYNKSYGVSLPLYYLWLKEGKISSGGRRVGICDFFIERDINATDYISNCLEDEGLITALDKFKVFDLDKKDVGGLDYISSEKIYSWIYQKYRY